MDKKPSKVKQSPCWDAHRACPKYKSQVYSFSICCSTGQFLLDFIKVNLCLAPITDCYPSWEMDHDVESGQHSLVKQEMFHLILLLKTNSLD